MHILYIFFRINTCLGKGFYGRSLRGDFTVDPKTVIKHLRTYFRLIDTVPGLYTTIHFVGQHL